MANVLGKLFIELGVNSAAFSEGMKKATYETEQFGKKTSAEFRKLGNSLSVMAGAFGAFGPAGAALASAVSLAGQAAGDAVEKFAKLGKSVGVLTGAAAGAVAGLASLTVATVGMVVHTSDEILHEMERQAQSAGVNVTEFSRLAYTTRVLGLDQETLVKGLQRMNRAALMAAEGSKQQQFAFQMLLGTGSEFQSVMRGGTVNLEALAAGFEHIHDPQLRSALAMQVFGRAGAELVPLLNQGADGLKKFEKEADALGVTVSEKTAKQAAQFIMDLTRIKEAASGIAIRITGEALPALDRISDAMVDFAKNADLAKSLGDAMGEVLVDIAKAVFNAAYAWTFWGAKIDEQKAHWDAFVEEIRAGYEYMTSGSVSAATSAAAKSAQENADRVTKEAEDRVQAAANHLDLLMADLNAKSRTGPEAKPEKGKSGTGLSIPSITTTPAATDQAKKFIETLEATAAAAKRMAFAVTESVGAQAMLNAQEEASKNIADQKAEIQERIDQLTKQIAENAKSYSTQQRAAYESEISQLKSYEAELDTNREKIVQLYATIAGSHEAKSATESLEAETVRYAEKIKALQADLAALASGHPFKTQSADLAGDIEKVQELQDALAKAQQLYGNNSDAVKELAHALDVANAALTKHREQLEQIDALQQQQNDLKKAQEAAQQAVNERIREEKEAMKKVVGEFTEGLSRAIVTGKENFRQLFASIEESIVKTGLTNLLKNLGQGLANVHKPGGFKGGLAPHGAGPLGMLGGLLGFGSKGKQPGSSPLNPMYTKDAGSMLGGGGDKEGGGGGLLGKIPGLGGGIFGKIFGFLGMFGGFLAQGGDVTPGRAYVVGEKHPEFFVPRSPGTVATRLNFEPGHPTQNNLHISTEMHMVDTDGGEEFIHRHSQAVADTVTNALRQRGVI